MIELGRAGIPRRTCSTRPRTGASSRREPLGGTAPSRAHGRRRWAQGPRCGEATTVRGVFCHNCGHRNPAGVNFCSSCGAVLQHDAPRRPSPCSRSTTTASRPTKSRGHARRGPARAGRPGGEARPQRRGPLTSLDKPVTGPAATPRATSSSTTSPCRGATPSSCAARRHGRRSSDVGSLNGPTSTASGSRSRPWSAATRSRSASSSSSTWWRRTSEPDELSGGPTCRSATC